MYDQNTEKLLTQINDRLNAPQYTGWLLFGGVALSIGVGIVNIGFVLPADANAAWGHLLCQ